MSSPEPPYLAIARRKQAERESRIPKEWRLPKSLTASPPLNVMDVPRKCGMLTERQLEITEGERWDGRGLVEEMGRGGLSAEEVVEAFCKRAAIAHQLTNCLTEVLFERALGRARSLDAHLHKLKAPIGPLHGLPVTVKDSFNISGVDSSLGIAALAFKPATSSAPLVGLLESLGAVIIAKTNIPQTLGALDSINNVFGRTMNPINRALTPGGSSGGEGVMTAMRGSVVGFGTDVGGSIRIPAMCNGAYGIKPSVGRFPYGDQEGGGLEGHTRAGQLQAVAGPLSANIRDAIWAFGEVAKRAAMWGEDCIPMKDWYVDGDSHDEMKGSGSKGEMVIGVLRSDGNTIPLPPIQRILDETKRCLGAFPGVTVVEMPTTPAFKACQSLSVKLMSIDGASRMASLLSESSEPLVPWLRGRFRSGKPYTVEAIRNLQNQRSRLEREMNAMWYITDVETGQKRQAVDAIICPIAPHPVPEIERWNAVGYTSSFVLLDWPAGCLPVRKLEQGDLMVGQKMENKVLGTWDQKNRELWDESTVQRQVYLDSPLCVQVVAPRLQDEKLCWAMEVIDKAIKAAPSAKL